MSKSPSPLLVTGASGHLGRRVLELLLEQGAGPLIATTRRPEALADLAARGVEVRRADFEDGPALVGALRGAKRALLVSTDAVDRPGRRLAQQRVAVQALSAAGVEHVVYTSMTNPVGSPVAVAGDHAGTEAALASTPLDFTVLRNNLYTDMLLLWMPPALASGQLVDARGHGSVAYVTREDCARVAAAALASADTGRRTLDVSGPESLTSADVATLAGGFAQRPITHVSVAFATLVEGMVQHGMARPVAEIYASFDLGIARGDFGSTSDTVRRLTGRQPQSVREFLTANRVVLMGAP